MKYIIVFLSVCLLSACNSLSFEKIDSMSNEERNAIFHFDTNTTQQLCGIYTGPFGLATKDQVYSILKKRGVTECFDAANRMVVIE